MKRRIFVSAGLLVAAGLAAQRPAATESIAQQRLRQLMQQARPGGGPIAPVTPERVGHRADLLAQGEAALTRLDTAAALSAFDQAAVILHAADTDMGLVRTYMQAGEYRRALAFGAHTAGAHLDVVGGAALYAWLLHLGGQEAVARGLLTQARARAPDQPLIADVERALRGGQPRASGTMLDAPARLAPYSEIAGLPGNARAVASATLVEGGAAVLAPAAALSRSGRYWVRNGLGQGTHARVSQKHKAHGLALLTLSRPLSGPAPERAIADAYPGSIAFAVGYPAQPDAAPAWPLLKPGFVGAAHGSDGTRCLGVELPTGVVRGGPVFDASGLLVGLGVASRIGDLLVPASQLQRSFGDDLFETRSQESAARRGPDQIYESALRQTLQLLRA